MLGLDRGFLSLEIETLNPGETIFAWGFGGLRPPNPPGKAPPEKNDRTFFDPAPPGEALNLSDPLPTPLFNGRYIF